MAVYSSVFLLAAQYSTCGQPSERQSVRQHNISRVQVFTATLDFILRGDCGTKRWLTLVLCVSVRQTVAHFSAVAVHQAHNEPQHCALLSICPHLLRTLRNFKGSTENMVGSSRISCWEPVSYMRPIMLLLIMMIKIIIIIISILPYGTFDLLTL